MRSVLQNKREDAKDAVSCKNKLKIIHFNGINFRELSPRKNKF